MITHHRDHAQIEFDSLDFLDSDQGVFTADVIIEAIRDTGTYDYPPEEERTYKILCIHQQLESGDPILVTRKHPEYTYILNYLDDLIHDYELN